MTMMDWEWGVTGVAASGVLISLMFPDPKIKRCGAGMFLGWFIPGLGHVIAGKWRKGLFFLGLLSLLYLAGLWICGFRTVSFEANPFYYIGQGGCGLYMLISHLLVSDSAFPRNDLPARWFDPGLLYVCVAGLLNLVIMINVPDACFSGSPRKEEKAGEEPSASPAPETASTEETA